MKKVLLLSLIIFSVVCNAQNFSSKVVTGADQLSEYLPKLKNKKVALLVNQTSVIKKTHLVDTLLSSGINIVKIFAPEHGFRGTGDAGEHIQNSVDSKTGLSITSMYGDNKKPSKESMKGIDIVVFDIQDVGARFYTYISSLQYMMEACADSKVPMLILDRPNPNGFYVDGPVMETAYKSFVGMQAIPIVHGMTVGEYATMLNGEGWLTKKQTCSLNVIKCKNYDHNTLYNLPIAPSPNLKSTSAILLYPSLCLFEGTDVSVGRGTTTPFEVWGHPSFKDNRFSFTPVSTAGAKTPPHQNEVCYGANLHLAPNDILKITKHQLSLSFIKNAYSLATGTSKEKFFNDFFVKLAGNASLSKQIRDNVSEEAIRTSWQPKLNAFKKIRKKYLLYKDFE